MQMLMRSEVVSYDSVIIHTNQNIDFILSSLTSAVLLVCPIRYKWCMHEPTTWTFYPLEQPLEYRASAAD